MQWRRCIRTRRIRSCGWFNISLARLPLFFIRLCQACNKNHPSNKQFHLTISLPHCVGLFSMPHLSSAPVSNKTWPHPTGRIRHTALMDVFNLKECKCRFKLFAQQRLDGRSRKDLFTVAEKIVLWCIFFAELYTPQNVGLFVYLKLRHLFRTRKAPYPLTSNKTCSSWVVVFKWLKVHWASSIVLCAQMLP